MILDKKDAVIVAKELKLGDVVVVPRAINNCRSLCACVCVKICTEIDETSGGYEFSTINLLILNENNEFTGEHAAYTVESDTSFHVIGNCPFFGDVNVR